MQPANIDLTVYKGATFSKGFQWKTGSSPVPVNLTGCTARMQIRKNVNDENILDTLTTENGKLSIEDAVNGKVRINISAAASSAYTFTSGVYDLEIVFPSTGRIERIIEGCFSAIPEVTR